MVNAVINRYRQSFNKLLLSIIAALAISLCMIVICSTFAEFIYTNQLANYSSQGLIVLLMGSATITLVTALFSSQPVAIADCQDEPLPLIAIITSAVCAQMSNSALCFQTVLLAIAITTTFTGIFLYTLGKCRLGNYARYIPFPVIAGFLASVGYLLILGGIKQAIDWHGWDSLTLAHFNQPLVLFKMIVVATFSLFFYFVLHKYKTNPLIMPLAILMSLVLFYLLIYINHFSIDELRNAAILLKPLHHVTYLSTIKTIQWQQIEWFMLAKMAFNILIVAIISALSLLFMATSIESEMGQDINFNHELRISGISNILGGFTGASVGYPGLALTMLNDKFRLASRSVGVFCAIIIFTVVMFFSHMISYIPIVLLDGILIYIGIDTLQKWTINIKHKVSAKEFDIILSILFIVMISDIFYGVLFGLILSIITFVLQYSKVDCIKYAISGNEVISSRQRDIIAQQLLQRHGNDYLYVKLQNYLFFGTAMTISDYLQQALQTHLQLKYIIMDFSHVSGIDSSISASFDKIKQHAKKYQVMIVLTAMSPAIYLSFAKTGIFSSATQWLTYIACHDDAITWCEEQILSSAHYRENDSLPMATYLNTIIAHQVDNEAIYQYFETIALKKGDILFHANDLANDLYYITSGKLSVQTQDRRHKLLTIGPGNIIGEIGLYLQTPRSATIYIEQDSILEKLTAQSFYHMQTEQPLLAAMFHRVIIKILSDKMLTMNKRLEHLAL
jgi:sulfate permease, SulP family